MYISYVFIGEFVTTVTFRC